MVMPSAMLLLPDHVVWPPERRAKFVNAQAEFSSVIDLRSVETADTVRGCAIHDGVSCALTDQ